MRTVFLQTQEQNLGQQQIQNLRLLQMNTIELERFIEETAQENPLIDLPNAKEQFPNTMNDNTAERLQWLEDSDYQNRAYYIRDKDDDRTDVFAAISDSSGVEITLRFDIHEQLGRKKLPKKERLLIEYLLELLDEDGYLRYGIKEIMEDTGADEETTHHALKILKSLEPAGIGAYDLAECLALQLCRRGSSEESICIAQNYLGELAQGRFRAISLKLGITEEQVLQIRDEIRGLNPRPGNQFVCKDRPAYVVPDVYVDLVKNRFVVRPKEKENMWFSVNQYYARLMKDANDKDVVQYLKKKMAQIEELNWGIQQREMTIEQISRILVERQQYFFSEGVSALEPLSMAEVADEIGVHVSTVSRAIKNKYLQYPGGLLPLRFFFVRGIATTYGMDSAKVGCVAAKEALKELVCAESKQRPFSDQRLSDLLDRAGYVVSRRTIAKYRDELGIPRASARREK